MLIDRTTSPDWPRKFNKVFRAKDSARVRQRTDQPWAEPSLQRIINRRWTQTGEQQSAWRIAQSVKSRHESAWRKATKLVTSKEY